MSFLVRLIEKRLDLRIDDAALLPVILEGANTLIDAQHISDEFTVKKEHTALC